MTRTRAQTVPAPSLPALMALPVTGLLLLLLSLL
jgi:hypothetical protein